MLVEEIEIKRHLGDVDYADRKKRARFRRPTDEHAGFGIRKRGRIICLFRLLAIFPPSFNKGLVEIHAIWTIERGLLADWSKHAIPHPPPKFY